LGLTAVIMSGLIARDVNNNNRKRNTPQYLIANYLHNCSSFSIAMSYVAITILTLDRARNTGVFSKENHQERVQRLCNEYKDYPIRFDEGDRKKLFTDKIVGISLLFDQRYETVWQRYDLNFNTGTSGYRRLSESAMTLEDQPKLTMVKHAIALIASLPVREAKTKAVYKLPIDKGFGSDKLEIHLFKEDEFYFSKDDNMHISKEAQQKFCLRILNIIDDKIFKDALTVLIHLPHSVSAIDRKHLYESLHKSNHQYLIDASWMEPKVLRVHRFNQINLELLNIAQKLETSQVAGGESDRYLLRGEYMSTEEFIKDVIMKIQEYNNRKDTGKIFHTKELIRHCKVRNISLRDIDYIVDIYTLQHPGLPQSWYEMRRNVELLWASTSLA
jgi:hypothetical protein